MAADIYVIGVPMYNFSVPSGFKAYVDQMRGLGEPSPLNPMLRPMPISRARARIILAIQDHQ